MNFFTQHLWSGYERNGSSSRCDHFCPVCLVPIWTFFFFSPEVIVQICLFPTSCGPQFNVFMSSFNLFFFPMMVAHIWAFSLNTRHLNFFAQRSSRTFSVALIVQIWTFFSSVLIVQICNFFCPNVVFQIWLFYFFWLLFTYKLFCPMLVIHLWTVSAHCADMNFFAQ